jgi:hypothetical protein
MSEEPMVHIPSFWGPLGSTVLGVLGFLAWFGMVVFDFPPYPRGGATTSAATAQEVREAEMEELIEEQARLRTESSDAE